MGLSEAVNELARRGLAVQQAAPPFRQQTHDLGRGVDVANVAEVLETLDGPATR